MDGWLRVATEDVEDDAELERWVRTGVSFVRTLPPKRSSGIHKTCLACGREALPMRFDLDAATAFIACHARTAPPAALRAALRRRRP